MHTKIKQRLNHSKFRNPTSLSLMYYPHARLSYHFLKLACYQTPKDFNIPCKVSSHGVVVVFGRLIICIKGQVS